MFSFFKRKKAVSSAQREHLAKILRQLDAVEEELRRIGYWFPDTHDLKAKYDRGELRTYLDAPSFELWLAHVCLPKARQVAAEAHLPKESQVGLMAKRQYDYHSYMPEAQPLLLLLDEFDRLVESYHQVA